MNAKICLCLAAALFTACAVPEVKKNTDESITINLKSTAELREQIAVSYVTQNGGKKNPLFAPFYKGTALNLPEKNSFVANESLNVSFDLSRNTVAVKGSFRYKNMSGDIVETENIITSDIITQLKRTHDLIPGLDLSDPLREIIFETLTAPEAQSFAESGTAFIEEGEIKVRLHLKKNLPVIIMKDGSAAKPVSFYITEYSGEPQKMKQFKEGFISGFGQYLQENGLPPLSAKKQDARYIVMPLLSEPLKQDSSILKAYTADMKSYSTSATMKVAAKNGVIITASAKGARMHLNPETAAADSAIECGKKSAAAAVREIIKTEFRYMIESK